MPTSCHIIPLTPTGRAAIASLRIEGEGASHQIAQRFSSASGQAPDQLAVNRIVFGRWRTTNESTEDVVLCRRGERAFELHCHGGHAAARSITRSLVDAGCRTLDWRSWYRGRAEDPIRAEARIALSEARTQRTARILLDQYHGALREALEQILTDIETSKGDAARTRWKGLLRWSDLGRHLTDPWKVVLAGPTNVGKSSLMNALAGFHRAIVYDAPGTTRDAVTVTTALEGWPVQLIDTAGLRSTSDAVEMAGVEKARCQLEQADVAILVFDLSRPWSDEDAQLVASLPDAMVVHNKRDLAALSAGERPPGLKTSALTGEGVAHLLEKLSAAIVGEAPPRGAAIPFTARHMVALTTGYEFLNAQKEDAAAARLRELLPHRPA